MPHIQRFVKQAVLEKEERAKERGRVVVDAVKTLRKTHILSIRMLP